MDKFAKYRKTPTSIQQVETQPTEDKFAKYRTQPVAPQGDAGQPPMSGSVLTEPPEVTAIYNQLEQSLGRTPQEIRSSYGQKYVAPVREVLRNVTGTAPESDVQDLAFLVGEMENPFRDPQALLRTAFSPISAPLTGAKNRAGELIGEVAKGYESAKQGLTMPTDPTLQSQMNLRNPYDKPIFGTSPEIESARGQIQTPWVNPQQQGFYRDWAFPLVESIVPSLNQPGAATVKTVGDTIWNKKRGGIYDYMNPAEKYFYNLFEPIWNPSIDPMQIRSSEEIFKPAYKLPFVGETVKNIGESPGFMGTSVVENMGFLSDMVLDVSNYITPWEVGSDIIKGSRIADAVKDLGLNAKHEQFLRILGDENITRIAKIKDKGERSLAILDALAKADPKYEAELGNMFGVKQPFQPEELPAGRPLSKPLIPYEDTKRPFYPPEGEVKQTPSLINKGKKPIREATENLKGKLIPEESTSKVKYFNKGKKSILDQAGVKYKETKKGLMVIDNDNFKKIDDFNSMRESPPPAIYPKQPGKPMGVIQEQEFKNAPTEVLSPEEMAWERTKKQMGMPFPKPEFKLPPKETIPPPDTGVINQRQKSLIPPVEPKPQEQTKLLPAPGETSISEASLKVYKQKIKMVKTPQQFDRVFKQIKDAGLSGELEADLVAKREALRPKYGKKMKEGATRLPIEGRGLSYRQQPDIQPAKPSEGRYNFPTEEVEGKPFPDRQTLTQENLPQYQERVRKPKAEKPMPPAPATPKAEAEVKQRASQPPEKTGSPPPMPAKAEIPPKPEEKQIPPVNPPIPQKKFPFDEDLRQSRIDEITKEMEKLDPLKDKAKWRKLYAEKKDLLDYSRDKAEKVGTPELPQEAPPVKTATQEAPTGKPEAKPGIKQPWEMTKEEFINKQPEGFVYDSRLSNEANAHTNKGKITVGDKFFKLSPESKQSVIRHELSHELESSFDNKDWMDVFESADKGYFGKKNKGGGLDGINGQNTPGENITEAYTMMFMDDNWLKKNYPEARRFTTEMALRKNKPVPPEVLKDYPDLAEKYKAKPPAGGEAVPQKTTTEAPTTTTKARGTTNPARRRKQSGGSITLGEFPKAPTLEKMKQGVEDLKTGLKQTVAKIFNTTEDSANKGINEFFLGENFPKGKFKFPTKDPITGKRAEIEMDYENLRDLRDGFQSFVIEKQRRSVVDDTLYKKPYKEVGAVEKFMRDHEFMTDFLQRLSKKEQEQIGEFLTKDKGTKFNLNAEPGTWERYKTQEEYWEALKKSGVQNTPGNKDLSNRAFKVYDMLTEQALKNYNANKEIEKLFKEHGIPYDVEDAGFIGKEAMAKYWGKYMPRMYNAYEFKQLGKRDVNLLRDIANTSKDPSEKMWAELLLNPKKQTEYQQRFDKQMSIIEKNPALVSDTPKPGFIQVKGKDQWENLHGKYVKKELAYKINDTYDTLKQFQKVTSDMEQVQYVKMARITRQNFKSWIERKEVPEKIRKILGEIKAPAYPVSHRQALAELDNNTHNFFKMLRQNPDWVIKKGSDEWKTAEKKRWKGTQTIYKDGKTYVRLGDKTDTSSKWGILTGDYVDKRIADDLVKMTPDIDGYKAILTDGMKKMNSLIKKGIVPFNISSQFAQFTTNPIFMNMKGVPMLDIAGLRLKSYGDFIGKKGDYEEASKQGLFTGKWIESSPSKSAKRYKLERGTMEKVGSVAESIFDIPSQIFQSTDDVDKLATYSYFKKKFLDEGKSEVEARSLALKEAKDVIPSYEHLPGAVRLLDETILPFISYPWRATGIVGRRAKEGLKAFARGDMAGFLRFYKYPLLMGGSSAYLMATGALDPHKVAEQRREYEKNMYLEPFRGSKFYESAHVMWDSLTGNKFYVPDLKGGAMEINAGNIMPTAQTMLQGESPRFSNLLLNVANPVLFNKGQFGEKISDNPLKRIKYAAKRNFAPLNKRDQYQRMLKQGKSPLEAGIKTTTGIGVSKIGEKADILRAKKDIKMKIIEKQGYLKDAIREKDTSEIERYKREIQNLRKEIRGEYY